MEKKEIRKLVFARRKAQTTESLQEKSRKICDRIIRMEAFQKADCIYTIPGNFGWDDVGNWLALERINATNELGNYIEGDVITVNTQRSTICGKNKLIAAVGVEDLIVIDTEDATLICAKDSTQDVKKVIENLKICNRSSLL